MNYSTPPKKCDVFITTNRNRVKTYGAQVYLKDGQKFEIEIFNPYAYKVLAKVKMSGHYISNGGLVINPGQRIYLERYLDSNNAFVFSTYDIDKSAESLQAISENGNLQVEFYSEYVPYEWDYKKITWVYYSEPQPDYRGNILYTTSGTNVYTSTTNLSSENFSSFSSSHDALAERSLETGRIEKSETTNQKFTSSNESFNSWAFETFKLKILPVSSKPTEVNEIRNYCTECGTRMKKATWKFCPNCGSKI